MSLRTEKEVNKEIHDKSLQIDYLDDFLKTIYKGSDVKNKVEKELITLRRELELLRWFIKDDNLPF